ncbi:MAG TPA: 30S ribosomal protein S16 [Sedimentisphaerales bacterium]|nr:30S ribosomal protein S16 [Sedimentisphaerales bacterium]
MSVKLRMTRMGRRHRPFFRINAVESRTPRDGRVLEKLGHYDPIEKDPAKQIVLDKERTQYWLDKGAIPSDTVSQILLRHGMKHKYAEEQAARRTRAKAVAQAKGKFFNKAQAVAAQKQAEAKAAEEKAKADAEAKAKADADAKIKAEAEAEAKARAEEEKAEAKAAEEKAKAQAETNAAEPKNEDETKQEPASS